MEDFVVCRPLGRGWVDTDLHGTVEKLHLGSRMCRFSLVIKTCHEQKLQLESALDSHS
jgi:hypothetical protein